MSRFAVGAVVLAVAASGAAPSAAAAPRALTGEALSAQANSPATSEPTFLALCAAPPPVTGASDHTATKTFSFSGTATGPFPGTFTESGSITTTFPPGFLPPGYTGTVQAFSASFRITSPVGSVTGTKTVAVTGRSAQCGGGAGGTTFSAKLTADFTAAITTATGSYHDRGSSTVDLGSAWQYANVSYATLSESFISAPVNTSPTNGTQTPSGTPPLPGVVQIRAQLLGQLIPSGKAASIGAILRHGGYSFWFRARTPGRVSISWYYYLPWAAKSSDAGARAVLVATGARNFAAAGPGKLSIRLTAHGRRLLTSARSLRLSARGTYAAAGMSRVSATRTITLRR